jgi:hypothetical protein
MLEFSVIPLGAAPDRQLGLAFREDEMVLVFVNHGLEQLIGTMNGMSEEHR